MPGKKPPERKLFTRHDVKSLEFVKKDGYVIRLGGGCDGDIFVGKIKFNNKKGSTKTKKVAIKRFDPDLSIEEIRRYKRMINDFKDTKLSNGNYLLPHMDFVKTRTPEGEKYVLAMDLFAKSKEGKLKTKFISTHHDANFDIQSAKLMIEAATHFANKGYGVYQPISAHLASFEGHPGIKLIDFESQHNLRKRTPEKMVISKLSLQIASVAEEVAYNYKDKKAYDINKIKNYLLNYSLKFLDKKYHEELKSSIQKYLF